ncbi:asparagine synthase, partial [Methanocaldococcus villosus KIN24-T80]
MCGIVGIVAKEKIEGNYIVEMLKAIEHRGKDGYGFYIDGDVYYNNYPNKDINKIALAHCRLAIVGNREQPIIMDNCVLVCNGEIYNYEDLEKRYNLNVGTDVEVILPLYKIGMLKELDGDFAFAIYDNNRLILGRDFIGVKPLFFVNSEKYFAFASERKALWKLLIELDGIEKDIDKLNSKINRVEPNSILIYDINNHKYNSKRIKDFDIKSLNIDYKEAKNILENKIKRAVYKRVKGLKKVGIIFSGGVDSSLITVLASKYTDVVLYTVGIEGSEDLYYAERLAKELNLPLKKKIIREEEYEKYLLKVVKAIDELDLMKIGVGLPIYIASELANKDGIKVILAGQGADELFAGYAKYLKLDKNELEKKLIEDVINISKVNLERDDHCSMANTVELRVPYLDEDVIKFSLSLPIEYKISKERKRILRDIAKNYLPD